MNIPDDIQAKIIAYLANELSIAEREDFENLINQDVELKQAIEEQRLMDSVFIEENEWDITDFDSESEKAKDYLKYYSETENKEFFEQLQKIDAVKNEKNKTQFNLKLLTRLTTVAAAVALFGIFAPQFFTTSNQQYYSKNVNYEQLPGFVEKGENDAILDQAQTEFEKGDYKDAAELFDQLDETDKTGWTRIYHALSLAELNQIDKALSIIEPVVKNQDSFQQKTATWYAGLIALKGNDESQAIVFLNNYLSFEVPLSHKKEALKILKKIE